MMNARQRRKQELEDLRNPRICTLDEALALGDPANGPEGKCRAIATIRERIGTRFSGPSNWERLTFGEQIVWEVTSMRGEVMNGGFHQYLVNSTGDTAGELEECLEAIRAVETMALLTRLKTIFPGGTIPKVRSERGSIMEAHEKEPISESFFDELDRIFYAQKEDLDQLMFEYVVAHRSEFLEPSDEVVRKSERRDEIQAALCGSEASAEWIKTAEQALGQLSSLVAKNALERDTQERERIRLLALNAGRIAAIRAYRESFHCGLGEANEAVEKLIRRD